MRLEQPAKERNRLKKGGGGGRGAKWNTYHGEVPLQTEEDLVPPHGLEFGHVFEEQQGLLHCVTHIAGHPSLEVPDGGTGW